MTQTSAILLAAYRNLNSRKLFWITLAISAIGVLAFALIGVNARGFRLAFWQFDNSLLNSDPLNPSIWAFAGGSRSARSCWLWCRPRASFPI
jgi:hypothetical protein